MDSFEKFSENKLPFFSSLKDECISKKDYLVNNIWNVFKTNKMGDYHDLHLKTNVLLLADVFEKFINTCLWIRCLPLFQFSWIKLGCNA